MAFEEEYTTWWIRDTKWMLLENWTPCEMVSKKMQNWNDYKTVGHACAKNLRGSWNRFPLKMDLYSIQQRSMERKAQFKPYPSQDGDVVNPPFPRQRLDVFGGLVWNYMQYFKLIWLIVSISARAFLRWCVEILIMTGPAKWYKMEQRPEKQKNCAK